MSREIRAIFVETCADCPHLRLSGALSAPAHKPKCAGHPDGGFRALPYTEHHLRGIFSVAQVTKEIPDWCPLERVSIN